MASATPKPIWQPSKERIERAHITAYMRWLEKNKGLVFENYENLWHWSIHQAEAFQRSIWEFFDLRSPTPFTQVMGKRTMPGAEWFVGAQVNYVEQVFRHATAARPAIVFRDEAGNDAEVSWAQLEAQVASLAAHLRRLGVKRGDRIAAYLPNRPETVVAFLACASLGAIWSICSPDMGPVSVLDRFRQIEPKILIACDGYRYGGKDYDRSDILNRLLHELPSIERGILVEFHSEAKKSTPACADKWLAWESVTGDNVPLQFDWLPFDHPLWIVYSSGTTGTPKAIVHGHGGIMLSMSVTLGLHNDLGGQDRYHWFSSAGWIMWNCQVGGLLVGATICIFDGNPGYPDLTVLWKFLGEAKATFVGAGAAFYASCLKADIRPNHVADLSHLRSVGSTGSPLSTECYEWIYREVGNGDIWLSPMSGGTDLAGPFVAGVPILPVVAGEMQCRTLGAAVFAFDDAGKAVVDQVGELVCTQPMPAMPLFFWNDPEGRRYLESYFDIYPGVWRHGDWIKITPRGTSIIYGRSDATINRYGIRMGTAELYRAVEALPEILDCLVVDLEYLGRPSYMPLFVVLRPGIELTDELKTRVNATIKTALSARHVPNDIFVVPEVPRTLSGKKLELPIKKLLLGQELAKIVNQDAMANPGSLAWFVEFANRRANASP